MTLIGKKSHPLTHPQKRIWYIEKIYPDTSLHNIGGAVGIKGRVDFTHLEKAILLFIRRNEGLRLRLYEAQGEAWQYVSEDLPEKISFFDFSAENDPHAAWEQWFEMESKKVFPLINTALFYFAMYKIDEQDNGYFVRFHHIVADGWSINIMTEQICRAYMEFSRGEAPGEEAGYSYLESIDRERAYFFSRRFTEDKRYWLEKFAALPEDFLRQQNPEQIRGKRKSFVFDIRQSEEIRRYLAGRRISLNTFFVGVLLLYLCKTRQTRDVVIGIPVLNRTGRKERLTVGMFTSTMPFRINIAADDTAMEFIRKVNRELLDCYQHQKYPYDMLAQDLALKQKDYDGLFQIYVNYYNTKLNDTLNGAPVENRDFYCGNQIYSLQVVIKEWSGAGCISLDFDYKISDYTDAQIERIHTFFTNLASQILSYPDLKIGNISLISPAERERLIYGLNRTSAVYPRDKTVLRLFEEQAEKTPHKTALEFERQPLTYAGLNHKANQLARFLREQGAGRETIIGLAVTHSMEMLIGILGILKAGAAYLPVEPGYPADRIRYMLDDADVSILLTNPGQDLPFAWGGRVFTLDEKIFDRYERGNLAPCNRPQDLAYVIYTSGSTGKPKGTMIEHRGLVNYIWWAKNTYLGGGDESFALYSSLAFDLTVTSIFTPLISGNRIIIYRDDGGEFVLYKICRDNRANIVKLTPAHLSLLKDRTYQNNSIKKFIVGGEDFKVSLAAAIYRQFGGGIEIYNEYGPTETVVGCMIHRYDFDEDQGLSVPIGVPADNVQIYILDRNLDPVPAGEKGEMYISGDGVARGYLNRPELTRECFMENPFVPGLRMYRTGDEACLLDNGKMVYLGRIDCQVKIRGHRIEPGEIERCLLLHEAVQEAVVLDYEDAQRGKYLCAYLKVKHEVSEADLRRFLTRSLPSYMIPSCFMVLPEIPLNINGKVDRGRLPGPPEAADEGSGKAPPVGPNEVNLAAAVRAVLQIDHMDMDSNFFHLGGDSIKAIQIAAKLHDEGFQIRVRDILSHPVLREMARQITGMEDANSFDQEPCRGHLENTPITAWFFAQKQANINYWHQTVLLKPEKSVTSPELRRVLRALISHHDALRCNYNPESGRLYYNDDHLESEYPIQLHDLSAYPDEIQDLRLQKIGESIKAGADIEKSLLFKAGLFELGPRRGQRILFTAHHLITDAVSWRIICEDAVTLLAQAKNGDALVLPPKTCSMQKWAKELQDYGREISRQEKGFWRWTIESGFVFPADFLSDDDTVMSGKTITQCLSAAETGQLLSRANSAYNTRTDELLIIALASAISDFTMQRDIIIQLEGHGREDLTGAVDVSRTVGWFTSIYPVRLLISQPLLTDQIKELKEQLRSIPNHGIGFGILNYLTGEIPGELPKQVRLNYLGDLDAGFPGSGLRLTGENTGRDSDIGNHLTALIDIIAWIGDKRLQISMTYSKSLFKTETITGFSKLYIKRLREIIEHCRTKDGVDFTPSDFTGVNLSQTELDKLFT